MKICDHAHCSNPKPAGPGRRYCDPCKAGTAAKPKPPCAIDDCSRPQTARGWCHTHYEHNRKYGTPHSRTMRDRFEEKVNRHGPETALGRCWLWTGTGTKSGYGQMYDASLDRHNYAHRISYELHISPIPDGLHIDHLCCVKSCVNPHHLEPVTPAENTRRAFAVRLEEATP